MIVYGIESESDEVERIARAKSALNGFLESRTDHWRWSEKNPEKINMPAEFQ